LAASIGAILAYGGAPSFFTVDLNGTKQTWTAFEYSANSTTDSIAVVVAADTIPIEATAFTTAFQRVGTGSGTTCTEQSGLQNTDIGNIFGSDVAQCSTATFSGQVTFTTTVPAGAEAGPANLSYSNSHASGEYFYDVTDPARVPARALLKKIKAYMATVRARQNAR
jgi:hypothetical protein